MSFSSELKNEMIANAAGDSCCVLAELSALLAVGGTVRLTSAGPGLRFVSESAAVTRRAFALVKSAFGIRCLISAVKRARLDKGNLYQLDIPEPAPARLALEKTGIVSEEFEFTRGVPAWVAAKDCCRRAYLRGVFLAGGTAADPKKSYHLEIAVADEDYAVSLCAFIRAFTLNAKTVKRKENYVVYIKDCEGIIDFMTLAGASAAVFRMEDARILKGICNDVNRAMNCDAANTEKSFRAAREQIGDIELITQRDIFKRLPKPLRETAEIRLAYPEATLAELGQFHNPPQSKSCVNHRIGKLRAIAAQMRAQEEEPT